MQVEVWSAFSSSGWHIGKRVLSEVSGSAGTSLHVCPVPGPGACGSLKGELEGSSHGSFVPGAALEHRPAQEREGAVGLSSRRKPPGAGLLLTLTLARHREAGGGEGRWCIQR